MNLLKDSIEDNFENFYNSSTICINDVLNNNNKFKISHFKESYSRLVSLQAWRTSIIEVEHQSGAIDFFKEAHNDALMSHILACQGAWRVALSSLRSCIENTLFGLYYLDHSVEMQLWEAGRHKLGFTEVVNYIIAHPHFHDITENLTGISQIKKEYALLSKAVHGSSEIFRMTKTGEIEGLNIFSEPDLGAWSTRESLTIINLNKILIVFFKNYLQGTANSNLRKSLSIAIPPKYYPDIRRLFGVNLRP